MLPAVLSAERVSIFRVMLKCDVHTNERSSIRGQNLTSNYTHSTAQRKRERERERERESLQEKPADPSGEIETERGALSFQ